LEVFDLANGMRAAAFPDSVYTFGKLRLTRDGTRIISMPPASGPFNRLRAIAVSDWTIQVSYDVGNQMRGESLTSSGNSFWATSLINGSFETELHDVATGALVTRLEGDGYAGSYDAEMAPDGSTFVSAEGNLVIRRSSDGAALISNAAPSYRVKYSRAGKFVVTWTSQEAIVFDSSDLSVVSHVNSVLQGVNDVSISPNDTELVLATGTETGHGGFVGCGLSKYSLAKGTLISTLLTTSTPVHGVDYSPDGRIAFASRRQLMVLNESGQLEVNVPFDSYLFSLANDGSVAAVVAYDGLVRRFSTIDGSVIGTDILEQGEVESISFAGNTKLLLSFGPAYESPSPGGISLWNLSTGIRERLINLNVPDPLYAIGDPLGRFIIVSGKHPFIGKSAVSF
jgi:hypothetical protein